MISSKPTSGQRSESPLKRNFRLDRNIARIVPGTCLHVFRTLLEGCDPFRDEQINVLQDD